MCIRDRCINAVSRRKTVFSAMNDLGSLLQPNPLFMSCLLYTSIVAEGVGLVREGMSITPKNETK